MKTGRPAEGRQFKEPCRIAVAQGRGLLLRMVGVLRVNQLITVPREFLIFQRREFLTF